jgi:hypothetical protein
VGRVVAQGREVLWVGDGRDAKVREAHADRRGLCEQDVLGLDVAVAHVPRVQVRQRGHQLPHHAPHLRRPPPASLPVSNGSSGSARFETAQAAPPVSKRLQWQGPGARAQTENGWGGPGSTSLSLKRCCVMAVKSSPPITASITSTYLCSDGPASESPRAGAQRQHDAAGRGGRGGAAGAEGARVAALDELEGVDAELVLHLERDADLPGGGGAAARLREEPRGFVRRRAGRVPIGFVSAPRGALCAQRGLCAQQRAAPHGRAARGGARPAGAFG